MRRRNSVGIDLVGVRSTWVANGRTTRDRTAKIGIVVVVARVIGHTEEVCIWGAGL